MKKLLYTISMLLIIAFITITFIDYSKYDANINSAPFTADILIRSLEFVLPSIIIFVVTIFMSKNIAHK